MPENEIYKFLKDNNLTDKDEKTFLKNYSDIGKAKELYTFIQSNGLTQKDFNSFYDTYLKKKEPSISSGIPSLLQKTNQPTNPLEQGRKVISQPFLKEAPITKALSKDNEAKSNWAAAKWNDLVGLLSGTVGGLYALTEYPTKKVKEGINKALDYVGVDTKNNPLYNKFFETTNRAEAKGAVENVLRSSKSSKEYEQKLNEFDITDGFQMSDLKGLLNSAPSQLANMAAAIPSLGSNYFFQAADQSLEELEKSPEYKNIGEGEKLLYATTQGVVQAALEKFAIDKVLDKTGLGKVVKNAVTKTVLDKFVKSGVKATAEQLENAVQAEVSTLAKKAQRVGFNAAFGTLTEGVTEGVQQGANDAIKLATNALKDKQIFDESDIRKNFWKNVFNASVGGGAFGAAFGGGTGVLKNTNKSIRKEVANAVSQEDVQNILTDINEEVEKGNITQDEAQQAGIKVEEYAKIAAKIPNTINPETKYAIIGGIEQRNNLQNQIEKSRTEYENLDPAFLSDKQSEIKLLEGKLGQVNDYLQGLITNEGLPEYKKEGDAYFKIDKSGNKEQITKEHFEIANTVKENELKKRKENAKGIGEEVIEPIQPIEGESKEQGIKEGVQQNINEVGQGESKTTTSVLEQPKIKPIKLKGTEMVEHSEDVPSSEGKENGINPTELTDKGKQEALELGKYIVENNKTKIISSDVERAKKTAEIAAKEANKNKGINQGTPMEEANGIKTESNPILNTLNIGSDEGKPEGTFKEKEYFEGTYLPEGAEQPKEFTDRMEQAYKYVNDLPKDVQVIAHSKVIRAMKALSETDGKWTDKTTEILLNLNFRNLIKKYRK